MEVKSHKFSPPNIPYTRALNFIEHSQQQQKLIQKNVIYAGVPDFLILKHIIRFTGVLE